MMELISQISTILTGVLALTAFIGVYKFTDLSEYFRIARVKKICEDPNATAFSIKGIPFDKDYLVLDNKVYWIMNHETLKYIMKHNNKFTDINSKKNYLMEKELNKYYPGNDLNIERKHTSF